MRLHHPINLWRLLVLSVLADLLYVETVLCYLVLAWLGKDNKEKTNAKAGRDKGQGKVKVYVIKGKDENKNKNKNKDKDKDGGGGGEAAILSFADVLNH
jgi:hypothetical protein